MPKHISVKEIIKHSAKFNLVSLFSRIISIPKAIIIAMVLSPRDYGIINLLTLWNIYAGLINPGLLSGRGREMPYLLGKGEERQALEIQNISQTSDLIYTILPFMVIFAAAFFFSEPVIRIGLILASFTFFLTHFVNYWRGVNFTRQKFTLVAKADFIQNLSMFIMIMLLIYWFKIYAVLIAPLIAIIITGIYYWKKGPINFTFAFNWQETVRLFKIGFPIGLISLVYWMYRYLDRTMIAATLSLSQLGLYSYAMTYTFIGLDFLKEFGNVLASVLWTKAGIAQDSREVFYETRQLAVYMALAAALMIPFSQTCFYLLVKLLVVKYIYSFPVFVVLSYNLYLIAMSIIPEIILQSYSVNKQVLSLKIYTVTLILYAVFNFIAIKLGYGILGVAYVVVFTQVLNTFLFLFFTRKYMLSRRASFFVFIIVIGLPFFATIMFPFLHIYLTAKILNPWIFASISLAIQLAFWISFIYLFYREYFPKKKIIELIGIISDFVSDKVRLMPRNEFN